MIEREKLQHLIENIGIPKLCLILLLGISLIIVSILSIGELSRKDNSICFRKNGKNEIGRAHV